jgi:hypothetical protein
MIGQTPKRIFSQPHPSRNAASQGAHSGLLVSATPIEADAGSGADGGGGGVGGSTGASASSLGPGSGGGVGGISSSRSSTRVSGRQSPDAAPALSELSPRDNGGDLVLSSTRSPASNSPIGCVAVFAPMTDLAAIGYRSWNSWYGARPQWPSTIKRESICQRSSFPLRSLLSHRVRDDAMTPTDDASC